MTRMRSLIFINLCMNALSDRRDFCNLRAVPEVPVLKDIIYQSADRGKNCVESEMQNFNKCWNYLVGI